MIAATPPVLVYQDNFELSGVPSRDWTVYNGVGGPGTDFTHWSSDNVSVYPNGYLNIGVRKLADGSWTAGGVSLARKLNFTYGKVRVRFRATAADGMKYCLMLWPQQGWPPEIDFAEDSPTDGSRTATSATLHYGSPTSIGGVNSQIHAHVGGDFTQWHTMGINWTPGQIQYTLDNHVWATTESDHVPDVPMHLAMQNSVHNPSAAANGSRLQIDFVRIYQ